MPLQEVIDVLREYVFDQMPIRLLKLPEVALIDRQDTFQLLLPKMEVITTEYLEERRSRNPYDWRGLIMDCIKELAPYAVLSHTWSDKEVTFEDWKLKKNMIGPGYEKLQRFCQIAAAEYHVSFAWMDTICINKESTSELDESIRSMYRWYEGSSICIAFLSNTLSVEDIPNDRWFTRGWTLQELLAPRRLKFYGKTWCPIAPHDVPNDKPEKGGFRTESTPLLLGVEKATGISPRELSFFKPGNSGEYSRTMAWAANRMTTRGEDRAYSLMGIFSVSFSVAYGEGVERAFFRLIEQILHSHRNVLDILNWAGRPISQQVHSTNLIPSRPECYANSASNLRLQGIQQTPSKPMILTHLGLQVQLLLVDALTPPYDDAKQLLSEGKVRMHCVESLQKDPAIVQLYNVHDRDLFGPFRFTWKFVFGIWNFRGSGTSVAVPDVCAAFLFRVPHVDKSLFGPSILASEYNDHGNDAEEEGQMIEEEEEEDELENLSSCMVETAQAISFESTDIFRRYNREKHLNRIVKLRTVYL